MTTAVKKKELTIENLKADHACSEGMAWITPILAKKNGATEARKRLITEKREWWRWALERDFDVTTGCAKELTAAGLCQTASNSGDGGDLATGKLVRHQNQTEVNEW